MTQKEKERAAQEARPRWLNSGRRVNEQITRKMALARLTVEERYDDVRKWLRKRGVYTPLACEAKFDRVVFTTTKLPVALLNNARYKLGVTKRLWKRLYRHSTELKGVDSIRRIYVEHGPNAHWAAPFRVTITPKDGSGLLPGDFLSVLEILTDFKLVLIEVAFDFPLDSIVDVEFVRRRLLSGKMWLKRTVGADKYHQKWGQRGCSKAVRAYAKWEASTLRVELQLHARFLRRKQIKDVFDFQRLPAILLKNHIWFADVDQSNLVARLRRNGIERGKEMEILKQVRARVASLWETLKFMRQALHLTNVNRLLRPLDAVNGVVADALVRLAAQWPGSPTRLGKTK
jgi:hypothetical protein